MGALGAAVRKYPLASHTASTSKSRRCAAITGGQIKCGRQMRFPRAGKSVAETGRHGQTTHSPRHAARLGPGWCWSGRIDGCPPPHNRTPRLPVRAQGAGQHCSANGRAWRVRACRVRPDEKSRSRHWLTRPSPAMLPSRPTAPDRNLRNRAPFCCRERRARRRVVSAGAGHRSA